MSVPVPKRNGEGFATLGYHYLNYDDAGGNAGQINANYNVYSTNQAWKSSKSPTQKGVIRTLPGGVVFKEPTNFSTTAVKNSFSPTRVEWKPYWWQKSIAEGVDVAGSLNDLPRFVAPSQDLVNQSIIECMLKLNDGKVELGTFLAESVKSAKMLSQASDRLLLPLYYLKTGQYSKIPKELKWLTRGDKIYLEWKYGWKPLSSDIYELFELSKKKLKFSKILHAKRTCKETFKFPITTYLGTGASLEEEVQAKTEIWAELDSTMLAAAQSYGVANPLSLAWELIPYSFVVDWFMPIGNYLNALTASNGLNFIAGYTGLRRKGKTSLKLNIIGSATQSYFSYERTKLYSFPSTFNRAYAVANPFRGDRLNTTSALLTSLIKT